MRKPILLALAGLISITAPSSIMAQTGGADDQSRVEAAANRIRMATPPSFKAGPPPVLGEGEKAMGHHGRVIIDGVVAVDGSLRDARVKRSSGVPGIDAAAVAAARQFSFEPAKDAAGAAMAVLVSLPFELTGYGNDAGGLARYRCDQFIRDMDWWRSANPGKPFDEHELYRLENALAISALLNGADVDRARLARDVTSFGRNWELAIEKCRKHPEMLQKDALFRPRA